MADSLTGPDAIAPGSAPEPEVSKLTLKIFLETIPPGGKLVQLLDGLEETEGVRGRFRVQSEDLVLHCDSEKCGGPRGFFALKNYTDIFIRDHPPNLVYVTFCCRNCGIREKIYSLIIITEGSHFSAYKLGEFPNFGPPTPPKVISLIRDEREYYAKGRRSENQGLGIAAFAYYRRVVENQKNRIFTEVIKASKKVGDAAEIIASLEAARQETQFYKAMETIKPAVPQALLLDGHNPLVLLHNALSQGLHAQTDEECLELAISIRLVLTELAERMATVLADHAELTIAVRKLAEVKAKKRLLTD